MTNKQLATVLMVASMSFSGSTLADMETTGGCTVKDSVLLKDVKAKIAADKSVSTSNFQVSAKDCVVTLTGNVKTDEEASMAIELAASTTGVLTVDTNKLTVEDSKQPFADAYITAKVKGTFLREKVFGDQPISVIGIHVDTKNGVVYLTGTADLTQAKNAEKLAKSIEGVKRVELKINEMEKVKE